MQTLPKNKIEFNLAFNERDLLSGIFIVVLHATRTPPHIGLIIDKEYHSLSIKGQDKNVPVKALLKNIEQRKIPSLFIQIKSHPTFSEMYLKEHFIANIQQFSMVDIGIATCLSPIKLFFEEAYNAFMKDVHFLYELIPVLLSEELIVNTTSCNLDEDKYELPFYTDVEINSGIEKAKKEINQLKLK